MKNRTLAVLLVGAGFVIAACKPGPPSRAGDKAAASDQAAALQARAAFLEGVMSRRQLAARLLDALATALPARVRLTETVYDSGEIRIKGQARTNSLLADYVLRLGGSPLLAGVDLVSSVQKQDRAGEYQEFALRVIVNEPGAQDASAAAESAGRLEELERTPPARRDTAEALRQVQQLASDSYLDVLRFAPGEEISREFVNEWPVGLEVSGSLGDIRRFLAGLGELPGLWLVPRFSLKAITPQDTDSDFRASISALAVAGR